MWLRSARVGRIVVILLALLPAGSSAAAAEPRTLTGSYVGFTVVERTACNGVNDVGMVCFDLQDTDTVIDVTIDDEVSTSVMGLLSYHYANGESKYMPRFCGSNTFEILYDVRGPAEYIVISLEPHGFAICSINPVDLPVRGTVTVTIN